METTALHTETLHMGVDVGITNLAFCIIDKNMWLQYVDGQTTNPGIIVWRNINLVGETATCGAHLKSKQGQLCGNKACFKMTATNQHVCKKHLVSGEKHTIYKAPKVSSFSLQSLKLKAFKEFDKIPEIIDVSHVAIETQIRKSTMKQFGTSIEAYFIIRKQIDHTEIACKVKNSPAKNKLKTYNGPPIDASRFKDPYDQRKYIATKQCEWFLRNAPQTLEQFYNHQHKKDDLADAFLHCLLYL